MPVQAAAPTRRTMTTRAGPRSVCSRRLLPVASLAIDMIGADRPGIVTDFVTTCPSRVCDTAFQVSNQLSDGPLGPRHGRPHVEDAHGFAHETC